MERVASLSQILRNISSVSGTGARTARLRLRRTITPDVPIRPGVYRAAPVRPGAPLDAVLGRKARARTVYSSCKLTRGIAYL